LNHATIRRNVALGLPDEEIADEYVWKALRAAQVDHFVRSLPGGLAAMVGARGNRLSGGECQRLGIARALYHEPQVLVVDEGTANLDNETEAAIVRTLARLRGEKTIIVVAHRLPLVRDCDRVYLLKQGQVRNSGGYAELVLRDPRFHEVAGGETCTGGVRRDARVTCQLVSRGPVEAPVEASAKTITDTNEAGLDLGN